MRILVSGSRGLIGTALIPELARAGHDVARLVRPGGVMSAGDIAWSPASGEIDRTALGATDAVVHLAGEPILGRWTEAKKRRIADSRVRGTSLLAEALATLAPRPRVFICVTGSGYYGNRGAELLTEESARGQGFLADTCHAWETATTAARGAGVRVVLLRAGLVLSRYGGLLGPLLLPFRLGLGGPIGRGRAYWSWIAIDDLIDVMRSAIETATWRGAFNTASPQPVSNAVFARTLGRVLRRPALLPVPPFVLRLWFGREAAEEAMLSSARLVPARLLASGFRFRYPELEAALRHVLGKA